MIQSMHIIGSRQLGGAEHFYLRFLQALSDAGHSVLAVSRPGSPISTAINQRHPQLQVSMANGFDIISVLRLRRLIDHTKPLIVQTYMGRATRLTRLPKNSTAVHIARLGGYYKIRGYYEHADAWVANTRGLCDHLVRHGLCADRVYRIGNFVEPKPAAIRSEPIKMRHQLGLPKDGLVVFSLGRFIDIKGFGDLLQAFDRLPRQINGQALHLVIAGDGPLRKKLQSQARQLGLTDRLHWVGWQNDPDPYYQIADLFVCPSLKETLGNVILEAWAHRLPVVSTRTPGGLDLIGDGHNGRLAEVGAPADLAERIRELLTADPAERRRLADNGFSTLEKNHSSQAVVKAYLDMYDTVWRQKFGASAPQAEFKV